ncbi:hypothetical protein EV652_114214 [Kribbella steppae]|uniref:Uncharacterized protein n=1 Tax=Kribbella steppae TaxID=2512223 RepID=A0A4R2H2Y1_9ACTN|nr:hypothetical protein EV652_114214 [Kribbella steppae]
MRQYDDDVARTQTQPRVLLRIFQVVFSVGGPAIVVASR